MSTYQALGQLPWTNVELIDALDEFAQLYAQRPVIDNSGGMKSPHLFCAWFVMKKLQPKVIIESGVWWGQGTWFFEKACPQAEIHCIDPNLAQIRYRSPNATYYCRDFSDIDWRGIPADETVLFFDDHQNAYTRLQIARWLGFRHLIFEDNYPASRGDCYSLKKAF